MLHNTAKTQISFKSGRTYFDQDKVDTIIIINKDLNRENRIISGNGAWIEGIYNNLDSLDERDDSFSIKVSHHYDSLKDVKLRILFKKDMNDTSEQPILYDSLSIPVQ